MIARQYEQYGQRQGVAEVEPVESCHALPFVLPWGREHSILSFNCAILILSMYSEAERKCVTMS
jgi:hypothetical protein